MRSAARLLPVAALLGVVLASASAQAIETGAPPQLPPPPPPPLTQQPAPPPPSKAAPPPSSGGSRGGSGASSSAPSSASSSSSSDGGSSESAFTPSWEIGGMLGVSTDYLNVGLGARGGKTFENHLYVGGSLLLHFAGSGFYNGYYGGSATVFYLGPEGGYDFDLHAVVLRAYLGLGPAFFSYSVNTPTGSYSGSDTRFVVWPGASVMWSPKGSPWFVGGDIRFVSVPGGPAVGFFAFGGIHLGE